MRLRLRCSAAYSLGDLQWCMVAVPEHARSVRDLANHIARLLELNLRGGDGEAPLLYLGGFLVAQEDAICDILRDDEVLDVEPCNAHRGLPALPAPALAEATPEAALKRRPAEPGSSGGGPAGKRMRMQGTATLASIAWQSPETPSAAATATATEATASTAAAAASAGATTAGEPISSAEACRRACAELQQLGVPDSEASQSPAPAPAQSRPPVDDGPQGSTSATAKAKAKAQAPKLRAPDPSSSSSEEESEEPAPKRSAGPAAAAAAAVSAKDAASQAQAIALATCTSSSPAPAASARSAQPALAGAQAQVSTGGEEGCGIFVGGLPYSMDDAELRKHFQQFGEVAEAIVVMNQKTGKSKGYGFVEFATPALCAQVLATGRNQEIWGKRVELKPRQSSGPKGGKDGAKGGKQGKAGKGKDGSKGDKGKTDREAKGGKAGKGAKGGKASASANVSASASKSKAPSDSSDDEEEPAAKTTQAAPAALPSKEAGGQSEDSLQQQMAALGLPVSFTASEMPGGESDEDSDED